MGSSEATSVIRLEKTRYTPGEKAKVHIDMDNSKCKKPVKCYKIKCWRKITCFGGNPGSPPLLKDEEFLVLLKYEGCAEKTRE